MADECNRPGKFVFYHYTPSVAAASIFTALFGISTIWQCWQTWRKRSWFMTPFIIGCLFETFGYIGRIWSSQNHCIKEPYIMQTLLLLLGPALLAASIYMILGRIIMLTDGEKYALIRRNWLTKIFVGGDVLSFLAQGAGGGILSSANGDKNKKKVGEKMIVAGLFIQLLFFGVFVIVSVLFQRKAKDHLAKLPANIVWKKHLYVLYGISMLIFVRSVFRVIEYIQGNDGYLLRNEVWLYIFDAALIFIVCASMNFVHPGDIAIMLKEKNADEFVEIGLGDTRNTESAGTNAPLQSNNNGRPWA